MTIVEDSPPTPLTRINPYGEFPLLLNPPYELSARCAAFGLLGHADAITQVVDSTFGWAGDHVRVEPVALDLIDVGGYLAVFCDYAWAQTAGPATGTFTYKEFTVFVPVKVTDVASGRSHLALHIPYIYLDNVLGIAAGQQIYGIPKKPARIDVPTREAYLDGTPFRVQVMAAETLSSPWQQAELFAISAGPHIDFVADKHPVSVGEIADKLATLLRLPIIQLKQVPAANPGPDGANILYRGVVELVAGVDAVENLEMLPPLEKVKIATLATERMSEVLGNGREDLSFAATFQMTFSFGPGKALYEEYA